VQGTGNTDRELMDAHALVGHLVRPGSVFAFLAQHRCEVFPAELFADLFPSKTGRPSLPVDVAASVLVLQTCRTDGLVGALPAPITPCSAQS
jgi:hypothetical protein